MRILLSLLLLTTATLAQAQRFATREALSLIHI